MAVGRWPVFVTSNQRTIITGPPLSKVRILTRTGRMLLSSSTLTSNPAGFSSLDSPAPTHFHVPGKFLPLHFQLERVDWQSLHLLAFSVNLNVRDNLAARIPVATYPTAVEQFLVAHC